MAMIPIIFEDTPELESGTLGVLTPGTVLKQVDADKIRQSLAELSEQISHVLQDIKTVGEFKLKEVELSVEINAEGGVALVSSAKVGAKGTMTLTFSA